MLAGVAVALLAIVATALVAVAMITLPAAADTTCSGTIGASMIDGNVILPADATCTLNGTSVDGDIQLLSGTSLTVRNTPVDGDLQFEQNRGPLVADGNDIDGNLQADQNTGGLTITNNRIGGNLQCQSDTPAPTGGANVVLGSAEGQCSQLEGPIQQRFTDVAAGSTHAAAIAWLVDEGITGGCAANRYCPGDPVTRAQMATFLDRALDLPDGTATFADVPSGFTHEAGIRAVAQAGITTGCTADRYCPGDPVTRGQMASFLFRALGNG